MPGELGKDARLDAVLRIGAAIEILGEQCLALGVGDEIGKQSVELLFALLAIAVPPHGVLGRRIDDRVLVLGRAAGVVAGLGAERAAVHERAFAVADGVLDQKSVGQIPVDAGEIFEAEFVGAVGAVPATRFLHRSLRLTAQISAHLSSAPEPCPAGWRRCATPIHPPASVDPISSDAASAKIDFASRLTGGRARIPVLHCNARRVFRLRGVTRIAGAFWRASPRRRALWRPNPPRPCAIARRR